MRFHVPSFIVVTTLLALLLVPLARAEDDPAQAYAGAAATLPAPSATHAMDWDGELLVGGNPVGTLTFKAEPTTGPNDELGWTVTDSMELAGGAVVRHSTATLDRALDPLRGRVHGKESGTESFEIRWKRTDAGFEFEKTWTQAGETKTARKTVAHEGRVLTGFTALWIFSKMTLPKKGSYAVTVFEPDPGQGDAMFEEATWQAGGEGDWKGVKALTVRGKKGKKDLNAFFHPETRRLLGVKTLDHAKNMAFEIRPKAAEKPEADDPFSRPAKTAQEAAMQAGLAFATGDLQLLGKVVHWPTVHDRARTAYDRKNAGNPAAEPFLDEAGYRAAVMKELEATLPKRPRPMIEAFLKASKDSLKLAEQDDGTTQVTFPPMFRSLVLTVGEVNGVWYLVRFPSNPK